MDDHESENYQRFSFTIQRDLIESVDHLIEGTGFNRSQVVRQALSDWVDKTIGESEGITGNGVATISYVYDHHESRVLSELMETQHSFDDLIQTTSHIHIDHSQCFEINICKGSLNNIKKISDIIKSIKGIHSFSLNYAKSERSE